MPSRNEGSGQGGAAEGVPDSPDRRSLLLAGALGAAGLAALTRDARAAAPNDAEEANIQWVNDYLKSFADHPPDPVRIGGYFTEDCFVRLAQTMAPTTGRAAAIEGFRKILVDGQRFEIKVLETYAKGPLVLSSRIDTLVTPGKPDRPFPFTGLFFFDKGKIKELNDYLVG